MLWETSFNLSGTCLGGWGAWRLERSAALQSLGSLLAGWLQIPSLTRSGCSSVAGESARWLVADSILDAEWRLFSRWGVCRLAGCRLLALSTFSGRERMAAGVVLRFSGGLGVCQLVGCRLLAPSPSGVLRSLGSLPVGRLQTPGPINILGAGGWPSESRGGSPTARESARWLVADSISDAESLTTPP